MDLLRADGSHYMQFAEEVLKLNEAESVDSDFGFRYNDNRGAPSRCHHTVCNVIRMSQGYLRIIAYVCCCMLPDYDPPVDMTRDAHRPGTGNSTTILT
jgi:hypothetical protein